jgi:hypothetical protein
VPEIGTYDFPASASCGFVSAVNRYSASARAVWMGTPVFRDFFQALTAIVLGRDLAELPLG